MNNIFFRTDMAVERRDLYKTANKIENDIKKWLEILLNMDLLIIRSTQ